MGFTLATKQPSATAPALAGRLVHLEQEGEVREFVNEVCRISRSQFAALLGNLALLIPLAIGIDFAVFSTLGHHILPGKTADYVLHSLDPLVSFTILNAALTGVYLCLSSIAAGWFENWLVFHRVPQGLSSSRRLVGVFGASGAQKIGTWTLGHATLFGGNVTLGFLMGFTSTAGRFFGIPLDVRHVTLSAASLTLASCTLLGEASFEPQRLLPPLVGVLLVGFLNFAVSTALALAVAVRAREVKFALLMRLLRAVRVRFRNRPRDFFYPPRSEAESVI